MIENVIDRHKRKKIQEVSNFFENRFPKSHKNWWKYCQKKVASLKVFLLVHASIMYILLVQIFVKKSNIQWKNYSAILVTFTTHFIQKCIYRCMFDFWQGIKEYPEITFLQIGIESLGVKSASNRERNVDKYNGFERNFFNYYHKTGNCNCWLQVPFPNSMFIEQALSQFYCHICWKFNIQCKGDKTNIMKLEIQRLCYNCNTSKRKQVPF
jgi:hypothetical protein